MSFLRQNTNRIKCYYTFNFTFHLLYISLKFFFFKCTPKVALLYSNILVGFTGLFIYDLPDFISKNMVNIYIYFLSIF